MFQFLTQKMSAVYYYVVGQISNGPPSVIETFEDYEPAVEFLGALLDLKNDDEDFYITTKYPGDIYEF